MSLLALGIAVAVALGLKFALRISHLASMAITAGIVGIVCAVIYLASLRPPPHINGAFFIYETPDDIGNAAKSRYYPAGTHFKLLYTTGTLAHIETPDGHSGWTTLD